MEIGLESIVQRNGHIVAVWRDVTIMWGGISKYNDSYDPTEILCHQDGVWTKKTTAGQLPPDVHSCSAQVVDDDLYLLCGFNSGTKEQYFSDYSNDVFKLDLNSWTWKILQPTGTRPLKSGDSASWLFGKKIFLFGGSGKEKEEGTWYPENLEVEPPIVRRSNNQLVYYDCQDNSWNWPITRGAIPSPRYGHGQGAFSVRIPDEDGGSHRCRALEK